MGIGIGNIRPYTIKTGPHQQQCQSNIVECYNVECCFDKVERCFDIVAQNGNIVEAIGNKVACCFDNVVSTLLLVWTGLYSQSVEIFSNVSTPFGTLAIFDIHRKFYGDRPSEPLRQGFKRKKGSQI